jgi:REP element-mobilizing transposase RayT
MSRPLRIEYAGAFYHVLNRGFERTGIYKADADKEYFLKLLDEAHVKYGMWVHTYTLMSNHYHLFLETPYGELSKIIKYLDGSYALRFNKKYNRVGPLFQGRYKAILVDQDNYALQVVKYIHLNPLKAKMVEKLEDYKWSSYPAYIGKVKPPKFLKTDFILGQFNLSKNKSINAFRKFHDDKEDDNWNPQQEAYKGLILGGTDFVENIQGNHLPLKPDLEIPVLKEVAQQVTVDNINKVLEKFNLHAKLKNKIRVYALRKFSKLTLKQILTETGNIHYSAITQINKRLIKDSEKNIKLKEILKNLDETFSF